jgi:hypothetical protein
MLKKKHSGENPDFSNEQNPRVYFPWFQPSHFPTINIFGQNPEKFEKCAILSYWYAFVLKYAGK